MLSEEELVVIEKNYGPYKKYPIAFIEYLDANYLIDSVPRLISEIRALRKVYEAGKACAEQADPMFSSTTQLRDAIAAYESGEGEKG